MSRHAVEVEHWLTAAQFTNIFASGWTIAEGASLSTIDYVVTAACTILFWKSHISPIPIIVAAGMFGWMRWI